MCLFLVNPHVCTFACIIVVCVFLSVGQSSHINESLACIVFVHGLYFFRFLRVGKAVPGAGLVLLSTVLKYEHPEQNEGLCVHRLLQEGTLTNRINMTHNHLGPAQTKAGSCNLLGSWGLSKATVNHRKIEAGVIYSLRLHRDILPEGEDIINSLITLLNIY